MKNELKSKKIKKTQVRPRLHSTWHLADEELEEIVAATNKDEEI